MIKTKMPKFDSSPQYKKSYYFQLNIFFITLILLVTYANVFAHGNPNNHHNIFTNSSNTKVSECPNNKIQNHIKNKKHSQIIFSEQEKSYIEQKKTIKMCVDPDWMPYEKIDENGHHVGLVADYIKIISKLIGIEIELVPTKTWAQSQEYAKTHKCDILSCLNETSSRKQYLNFTKPYIKSPSVIVTCKDQAPVDDLKSLNGKTLAIVKGYAHAELIKRDYKNINIIPVDNTLEGLQSVADGEIFAYTDSLYITSHKIAESDFSNLTIAGFIEYTNNYRIGIRKDDQILLSIFEKALDSISYSQHIQIRNKWVPVIVKKDHEPLQSNKHNIIFSQDEQTYLKQKKIIFMCVHPDRLPYEKIDEFSKHTGLVQNYVNFFSEVMNIPIVLIATESWAQTLDIAKQGKCDIVPFLNNTEERKEFLNFTTPYMESPIVIITKKNFPLPNGLSSIKQRPIGMVKNSTYKTIIQKHYPNMQIVETETIKDGLLKVAKGDLFAFTGSLYRTLYNIQELELINLYVASFTEFISKFRIGVKKEDITLLSIFDKIVKGIPPEKHMEIRNKCMNIKIEESEIVKNIMFTNEEKSFLSQKNYISMCVRSNWMPYESIDTNGNHVGIAADIIKIIEKQLNKKIVMVPTNSCQESIELIQNRQCDIISSITKTPQNSEYLDFTKSYINFPNVIITRDNGWFIDDMKLLNGKTVGYVKGCLFEDMLKKHYPQIKFVAVESIKQGLEKVSKGEILAYIDALATAGYYIRKEYITNVQVAGHVPERTHLSIGVKKNNTILLSILNKAIDSLSTKEQDKIFQKWIRIKFEEHINYTLLWRIFTLFSLIVIIIILWNRKLSNLNQQINLYLNILDKNVITVNFNKSGTITDVNTAFIEISGYNPNTLVGKTFQFILSHNDSKALYKEILNSVIKKHIWTGELKIHKTNRQFFWSKAIFSPIFKGKSVEGYLAIFHDITDKKRVEKLSITDDLTTLYNRRHFNTLFMNERNRAKRDGKIFTLIIMDVDSFKKYNDRYGHNEGDSVLATIGKVLKNNLRRGGDYAFRLGGEEFGGIITSNSCDQATKIAEFIRKDIENLNIEHIDNQPFGKITISIGIKNITPDQDLSQTQIYTHADQAMYIAKQNGKNCIYVYS